MSKFAAPILRFYIVQRNYSISKHLLLFILLCRKSARNSLVFDDISLPT